MDDDTKLKQLTPDGRTGFIILNKNMTAEQFFIEQFNKCTWVEDDESPGNIYMVCDKHHKRKMKMSSIFGNDKEIKFIKTEDTLTLFYQDHKNGIFDVNYDEVWSVFEEEYSLEYSDIQYMIVGILDDVRLKILTPLRTKLFRLNYLNNDTKLNVLTPGLLHQKYL